MTDTKGLTKTKVVCACFFYYPVSQGHHQSKNEQTLLLRNENANFPKCHDDSVELPEISGFYVILRKAKPF